MYISIYVPLMCVTVNKLTQLSVSETTVGMEMGVVYEATELS